MKGKRNNDSRDYRGKGRKGPYKSSKTADKTAAPDKNPVCGDPTKMNDIAWYAKNPTLLEATAKLSFPYRAGMPVPIARPGAQFSPGGTPEGYTLPGTLNLAWVPFAGGDGDPSAPANIAGREIFNKVRAAFSGSLEADAPDFVTYFLALDSIFSYIGSLKRVFRIIANYSPDNMNLPVGLLNALGITKAYYSTLSRDRMQLFAAINELVHMTDKFVCPAVFPLFERHYWLNDNVYADADSMNSQFYVFTQKKYMKFAMLNSTGGTTGSVLAGGLQYVDAPSWANINGLYTFGTQLINALSAWDDAFIISGYLRRAFEGQPAFKVDEILYNDRFTPVYVPEVLAQIENAFSDLIGGTSSFTAVVQDPGTNTIKTLYTCSYSGPVGTDEGYVRPYLNIRSDVPSITEVVEATRLQTYVTATNNLICGTEALVGMNLWTTESDSTSEAIDQVQVFDTGSTSGSDPTVTVYNEFLKLKTIGQLANFDWHPFIFFVWQITQGSTTKVCEFIPYGDVHNFTTFDLDVLKQLNRVCLFSEFNAFGID